MNTRAVKKKTSPLTSLHQYLDTTCNWNIGELKTIITQNPSSINTVRRRENMTPLIKVLESEKCTVDIIKLLLDHGADINFKERSPLMVALGRCADDKVIAMLLDNGAKVDVHYNFLSPLCVALRGNCSKHVIKLLLDTGCSVHACKFHASLMHCFCHALPFQWGMREDVLRLIIEAGTCIWKLDLNGQSPMCLALRFGARPNDIKLLMRVGISLTACKMHPSPFHCFIEDPTYNRKLLEGDVVKVLLDSGARFDTVVQNGSTLLHDILRYCEYENEAIRLLLDVPGVDVNGRDQRGETLLHCAVKKQCRPSVLKLLLDKGAEVDKLDTMGETALDVAIRNNNPLRVINFLLKKGSPINTQDLATSRPLMIAVERAIHNEVVMTLLIAGARVGMTLNFFWTKMKLKQYLCHPEVYQEYISEVLDCIKCFIKCYILEGSEFPIVNLTPDPIIRDELRGFAEECKLELGQMDSERVGYCRTLRQLISRKSPPRTIAAGYCMSEGKYFDFNRLLEALSGTNAFPLYFDFISASVGKEAMEKKLQEVSVYTVVDCPDSSRTDKKVTLNCDIVLKIASLLSDAELLKLILAFDKPKNNAGSKRSQLLKLILAFDKPKNHAGSKRGIEEQDVVEPGSSYSQKRPKQV